MGLVQLDFNGSPYLGVFARANESVALVPPAISEEVRSELARALDVEVLVTNLGGSSIVGAVIAMNTHGAVVADFADEAEVAILKERGLRVSRIAGKYNAAGNNVLTNDRAALVNPDLGDRAVALVGETLGVKVRKGTIAGLKTVGSSAVVNAKGALCHPKSGESELEEIESFFEVEADIGTVNHGAPYIGAGMVANSKGAAIGSATTGPELNRIEDALRYY